jgi:hypothetical protein
MDLVCYLRLVVGQAAVRVSNVLLTANGNGISLPETLAVGSILRPRTTDGCGTGDELATPPPGTIGGKPLPAPEPIGAGTRVVGAFAGVWITGGVLMTGAAFGLTISGFESTDGDFTLGVFATRTGTTEDDFVEADFG